MRALRFSVIVFGLAMIMVIGLAFAPVQTTPKPARATQEGFDHSNCQYPHRTTNPPNGCDNSDPCDPANVKGGSGDCESNNEDHAPIVPQPVAPTPTPTPEPKHHCEGK